MRRDFVIDTDALLLWISGDERIKPHLFRLEGSRVAASFATLAELELLQTQKRPWAFKISVEEFERSSLLVIPKRTGKAVIAPVIWPDAETCTIWARLAHTVGRDPEGRPRHSMDLWIAATAIRHRLALLTGNRKHFRGIPGLELL